MRKSVQRSVPGLILLVWLAGCGGSNPEVWLEIVEDGTHPCLGAAHLKVEINVPGGTYKYDEFGLFFNPDQAQNFRCEIPEFRFSNLRLSEGVQVAITLHDSTTEEMGILALGTSQSFNVTSGSPIQALQVNLSRSPLVQKGTTLIWEPDDWWSVQSSKNVASLQFQVTKNGETIPSRFWFFAYDPDLRPDPFPLVISNLPWPAEAEVYDVVLEALDSGLNVVHRWEGGTLLQQGSVWPANVTTPT